MEAIADLLLFGIALIAIIFASVTDIKKHEVPNWLNFSLLGIALAIRGIASILLWEFSYFYWALIAVVIFYALGNIFYYGNILGGGDVKLLIALSAVFATKPYFVTSAINEPFLLTFLINALLFGAIWAIIISIYYFFKIPKKEFSLEFKKLQKKIKLLRITCLILALVVLVLFFVFDEYLFILVSIVVLLLPYLYSFIKIIEDKCLIKEVKAKDLREGDYLLDSIKVKKIIIKKSIHGLSSKDISLLKRIKKKVLIKEGIVFVPLLLLALLASLFYGNILFSLLQGILS
jgi:Flp pilus assembly protein protease CpaA